MIVYVRPATADDSEKFALWFSGTSTFRPDLLSFPQTYTLCAFNKKVLGFLVVQACPTYQVLYRFVPNPEASEIEKALASCALVQQVITFGFINVIPEIFFMGNVAGTNRIAQREFKQVPLSEYSHVFKESEFPVYRLRLSDL